MHRRTTHSSSSSSNNNNEFLPRPTTLYSLSSLLLPPPIASFPPIVVSFFFLGLFLSQPVPTAAITDVASQFSAIVSAAPTAFPGVLTSNPGFVSSTTTAHATAIPADSTSGSIATATGAPAKSNESAGSNSNRTVVGGAVGGAAGGVALVGALLFWFLRRRRGRTMKGGGGSEGGNNVFTTVTRTLSVLKGRGSSRQEIRGGEGEEESEEKSEIEGQKAACEIDGRCVPSELPGTTVEEAKAARQSMVGKEKGDDELGRAERGEGEREVKETVV